MKRLIFIVFFTSFVLNVFSQKQIGFKQPEIWIISKNINDSLKFIPDKRKNNYRAEITKAIDYSFDTMNFHPCLSIEQLLGALEVEYEPRQSSNITVFSVYKPSSNKQEYSIWSLNLDSASNIFLTTQSLRSINTYFEYSDSTINEPVINLFKTSWINQNIEKKKHHFTLLSDDSLSYKGKFAEFLFYDEPLTEIEISKIYTYLAIKYGISINTINYISSKNSIIWDAKENTSFAKNIAGIGRDTILGVNQKQSSGSAGKSPLTISVGTIEPLNSENQNKIEHHNFLIWGDNGKSLTFTEPDTSNLIYWSGITNKKWLMQCSGETISKLKTNIRLKCPIISDSTVLILLINRSSDFDFPKEESLAFYPDSLSQDGYWYFSNITWDSDGSGKDAFAFCSTSTTVNEEEVEEDNFIVELFDDDFNANESDININDNNTLGAVKFETVDLYPNPTYGNFSLHVKLNQSSTLSVEIYDSSLRQIQKESFQNQEEFQIDKYIKRKGAYLIVLRTNSDMKLLKIVIN